MDSLELARKIADIIVEKQGEDILILDLHGLTTITDYFVICSGGSRRQLDAIKNATLEGIKKEAESLLPKSVEGNADSGWILIDYIDVIVHLFDADIRDYYQIEDLWKAGRVVAHIQ